jgi:LemA protein
VRRGLSISDMGDVATSQDKAVKSLVAVAEQYPTLKADTVFSNLQRQLTEENAHFAAAKRVYNSNVSLYNQYIVAFPASFVAGISGASKRDFFAEDNVESKRDIKFEF